MQKISVHIPDEMKLWIALAAKANSQDESEVIREAIDEGLKIIYPKGRSAQALLELAKLAEQLPSEPGVPKDLSTNHDYYTWGGEKHVDQ